MIYKEEIKDLFSVSNEYYLVQCISADFAMGKGIAVEFNKRFNTKNLLKAHYPRYFLDWDSRGRSGDCILEGKVFNLITKKYYYNKPTLYSISFALKTMKDICEEENINKIAMPLIGCGLDKLSWDKVSKIIKVIFKYTDIEILVCRQR